MLHYICLNDVFLVMFGLRRCLECPCHGGSGRSNSDDSDALQAEHSDFEGLAAVGHSQRLATASSADRRGVGMGKRRFIRWRWPHLAAALANAKLRAEVGPSLHFLKFNFWTGLAILNQQLMVATNSLIDRCPDRCSRLDNPVTVQYFAGLTIGQLFSWHGPRAALGLALGQQLGKLLRRCVMENTLIRCRYVVPPQSDSYAHCLL
jgi:hypothetical protein